MKLHDLQAKRNEAIGAARAIQDKADAEKRSLTADEAQLFDKAMADAHTLRADIDRETRLIEAERELATKEADKTRTEKPEASEARRHALDNEEYRAAMAQYFARGRDSLSGDQIRALSAGVATEGGYFIPQQMTDTLIKAADDAALIRNWATKFNVAGAANLGAVSLDNDPADADWTSELATGTEDTAMSFGKRELKPSPLAKRIKISNKLLRQVPSIEGLVMSRLGYKFGITQEKVFMTGNGAEKPLGLFTASNDGVPTSRDFLTGSATNFTMDGLIAAKYSLKTNYLAKCKWLFHRDGVSKIAQLKDSTNNYLWQPSNIVGEPDRIIGLPVFMDEYVPNTFTTGLYVGMLADFSYYWIADAMSMQVQRLVELYAETNQTGFIGRLETDGMPVLAEAFVRLKTS